MMRRGGSLAPPLLREDEERCEEEGDGVGEGFVDAAGRCAGLVDVVEAELRRVREVDGEEGGVAEEDGEAALGGALDEDDEHADDGGGEEGVEGGGGAEPGAGGGEEL